MLGALDDLDRACRDGTFRPTAADEDVHTALERGLLERLGALGGKLRAGRSRNDQVATDLRLYLRDHVRMIASRLAELETALIAQAERHVDVPAARDDPPAARAAGAVRPSAAGARAGVRAGRGPAAGLGQARRGLARWARARWPARRCRWTRAMLAAELGFERGRGQLDRRGQRPGLRRRVLLRRGADRRPPVPARRGDRAVGLAGVRLGRARRRASRPARRSCRRRRTPTWPSWRGARPAA